MKRVRRNPEQALRDLLGRWGDLREAKLRVLKLFCEVSEAACGQITDTHAWLQSAKIIDVAYAAPNQCSPREFKRMIEAYKELVYPDDFRPILEFFKSTQSVIVHSQTPFADRLRDSGFFTKFMAPFGIVDGCSIFLRAEPVPCRYSVGLSTRRAKGFRKRDIRRLAKLAALSGPALENLAFWHEHGTRGQSFEKTVSQSAEPLVVLARKSKQNSWSLDQASPAAVRALAPSDSSPDNSIGTQAFCAWAARSNGGPAGTHLWTGLDGFTYRVFTLAAPMGNRLERLLVRLQPTALGSHTPNHDRSAALRHGLSPREAEVFVLIASGKTNKEIATTLRLAYDTVRAHVRNIFGKVKAASRIEAVQKVRNGNRPAAI